MQDCPGGVAESAEQKVVPTLIYACTEVLQLQHGIAFTGVSIRRSLQTYHGERAKTKESNRGNLDKRDKQTSCVSNLT